MRQDRFAFLDAIRGIAAIFVLIRHTPGLWNFTFDRSYLAVDLFFLLSGFVIAHAYDEKLSSRTMSFPQFAKVRLVRLYPIYIFSIYACLTVFYIGPYLDLNTTINFLPIKMLLLPTVTSMFFIPFPINGKGDIFPLNGVYWSLLYELIANFSYAISRQVLTDRVVYIVIMIAMVIIALVARYFDHLDAGFSTGWHQVAGGLARSAFGFFTGLFLYRKRNFLQVVSRLNIMPWLAVAAVAVTLSLPRFKHYNGLVDLVAVFLVFPLAMLTASRAAPTRFNRMLVLLGSASYPIYVLHRPLGVILTEPLLNNFGVFGGPVFIGIMVGAALLLERNYDIPVRQWLMRLFPSSERRSTDRSGH